MKLADVFVAGLAQGLLYSLVALGFVLIYRATEVVNFAHVAQAVAGIYVVIRLQEVWGFWLAVLAATVFSATLGLLINALMAAPMRRRGDRPDHISILTLGLYALILAEVNRRIGADTLGVDDPWGASVAHLGSIRIPYSTLASLVVSTVVVSALLAANRWTGWGLATRAAAEDQEAAGVVGVRRERIAATAWATAGAMAVLAGLFMTVFPTPGLNTSSSFAILAAFPAAIIGGLDSLEGAVFGGVLIGLVQQVVSAYADTFTFLGHGSSDVVPWAIMLVVLMFRPRGVFGRAEVHRV